MKYHILTPFSRGENKERFLQMIYRRNVILYPIMEHCKWFEFPNEFLASLRVGFYLRVLEEGKVGAGDPIERVHLDPERLTVKEAFRLLYFDKQNLEGACKALRIKALSPAWRDSFEKLLETAPPPARP